MNYLLKNDNGKVMVADLNPGDFFMDNDGAYQIVQLRPNVPSRDKTGVYALELETNEIHWYCSTGNSEVTPLIQENPIVLVRKS